MTLSEQRNEQRNETWQLTFSNNGGIAIKLFKFMLIIYYVKNTYYLIFLTLNIPI